MLLPIRESDAPGTGPYVRLNIGEGRKPRVVRQGQDLLVEAGTAAELEETVLTMLRALDRKYWTPDWFGATAGRAPLAEYRRDG